MFGKNEIINNAVPAKIFIDNLGLYDNFHRNVNDIKSGFKVKRVGGKFFILLPEWFMKIIEAGYSCYAIKAYDDFEYEFKISLTKKTEIDFYKL
ncbi:hypothetical protein IY974_01670 [Campylobacter volucris]|uniref:hypothetical protein n=1 Tax=Campylobacter volucris TaxID=1031542 RepID=UPI00189D1E0B|nr:hypothetical protein [Campylobacter volucris]MBF7045264.1 hypothetical protein [Campylobacter volucris]